MNLRNKLILFVVFLFSYQLSAQDTGNSPYSSLGIGDLNYAGTIRNIGMGNTGISNANPEFINILNPALLPVNKFLNRDTTIKFTMLEGGFLGDHIKQSTSTASQSRNGFNLQFINFAFPVGKHWTTSVGLRPYSTVRHQVSTIALIQDSIPYLRDDYYKGGLNQVHFANGFDVTKNFSVGLLAGYIFGNINQEKIVQSYVNNFYTSKSGFQNKSLYRGFQLKPGIAYRMQLKDSSGQSNGIFLNAGLVYEQFLSMKGESTKNYITKSDFDQVTIYDSSLTNTQFMNATFPTTISGGLSIDKIDKWSVALDFHHTKWQNFQSLQSLPPDVKFMNTYSIGLGGEFKPGSSVSLTSKQYRAGINYSKLPYSYYERQLDDISISIGSTIPLGRKDPRFKSKPLTKINLALVYGQRGTKDMGLVHEQYFKFFVSALIQDKWFQRWKID